MIIYHQWLPTSLGYRKHPKAIKQYFKKKKKVCVYWIWIQSSLYIQGWFRGFHQCSHRGLFAQKGPMFALIVIFRCSYHLEIWTSGSTFSFCTGPRKLYSQSLSTSDYQCKEIKVWCFKKMSTNSLILLPIKNGAYRGTW